ncbi:MAG: PqiC family protein [Vibrio sp.]
MKSLTNLNHVKSKHWLTATALVSSLLLGGCAAKPEPMKTYALIQTMPENGQTAQSAQLGVKPIISVDSVEMAGYLTGNGIVMKTSPTQYIQAQNNIWIDDISAQVESKLVDDIQVQQSKYDVLPTQMSLGMPQAPRYQVAVYVSDFYGHYDGYALLAGDWQVKDSQGNVVKMKPYMIKTPLAADGYDALVQAMSQSVDTLAKQISAGI